MTKASINVVVLIYLYPCCHLVLSVQNLARCSSETKARKKCKHTQSCKQWYSGHKIHRKRPVKLVEITNKKRKDGVSWLEATGEIAMIDTYHKSLHICAKCTHVTGNFLSPKLCHKQLHFQRFYWIATRTKSIYNTSKVTWNICYRCEWCNTHGSPFATSSTSWKDVHHQPMCNES